MPGKVTPVVGYQMPGAAITMPVVRSGTQTPEISFGGGAAGSGDWNSRSTATGVERAFAFDTAGQLGTLNQTNFDYGYTVGTSPPFSTPTIDTSTGVLKFALPALDGTGTPYDASDPCGGWGTPFPLKDVGDEFYVQIQTRWNQAFFDVLFRNFSDGTRQAGIKLFDVAAGDQYGSQYWTSADLKMVVQTYYELRTPHVYCYTKIDAGTIQNKDLSEPYGGNAKLQNVMPDPYCLDIYRTIPSGASPNITPTGCFNIVPNIWMVWLLWVKLLDRVQVFGRSHFDFQARLWGMQLGQTRQLLLDWGPSTPGYFPMLAEDMTYAPGTRPLKFGKVWAFPYITDRTSAQVCGQMIGEYNELIISTQDIADPAAPNPTLTPLAANTLLDCGPWVATEIGGSDQSYAWYRYSGFAYDAKRRQMVCFGGGHASTNYNAINCFRMDTLDWHEEYPPSPQSAILYSNIADYDFTFGAWHNQPTAPSTRANSRHTEDGLIVIGDELIVLQAVEGNAAGTGWPTLEGPGSQETVGKIAHYNFNTKTWSFSNDGVGSKTNWYGTAYDPISGKILRLGRGATQTLLEIYDPLSKTRSTVLDLAGSGAPRAQNEVGQVINVTQGTYDIAYNNSMCYVPDDGTHGAWMDKFYYFARSPSGGLMFRITYDRNTPSNSLVVLLGTNGTPFSQTEVESGEVRLAWDSKNKIIGVGPKQGSFYAFDPQTKTWGSKSMQGGAAGSVVFHCLQYCPVNNVFMFFDTSFHMWAYRWN